MIRLYNARILSMVEGEDIYIGEIWVKDDKILYIGQVSDRNLLKQELGVLEDSFTEEIDCLGNVLMPGFKNAHTHSGMTLLRTKADDMPLDAWLNQQIFPVEAKLDSEMIYHTTQLANMEYLTSGITACFDMYLTPESVAKCCIEDGMRVVQVGNINNFSSSIPYMEEVYHKLNSVHPLSSYMIGFHAEYTCSLELMEQIAALANKCKSPVYAHNSETKFEVDGCIERYGKTPTQLMDELGMFTYGGGGYHCVYMSDEDLDIFQKRGLYAVTNPASNAKLASGIAPINSFLKRGIPVAIGTDGPASNNCLDMFREMFLVTGLAKIREQDASAVDALEVLKMATVNGALAMGLRDCDVLAVGKQADIIMIDLHQPNMQPLNNIPKNIVYSGSKQNVKLTMIAGQILYRDGQFADRFDPEQVYAKVNEIINKVK